MEIKDFCSYELSMKLKEAGFNEDTLAQWAVEPDGKPALMSSALMPCVQELGFEGQGCYRAVLYEAQKWLREAKNIDVLVWNCACGYGWDVSKAGKDCTQGTTIVPFDESGNDEDSGKWRSYEDALSAGIERALEVLKRK